jgi:RHS repeat-associated protein
MANYTLDLAAGQRPLVATPHGPPEGGRGGDSTHYLYGHAASGSPRGGHGPFGERTARWALYLPDGTGSVRQLTDLDGQVSLARRFSPWGELLEQDGGGDFAWGYFTGEWRDASGLIHLRARYYAPAQGRFLSRDAWEGDYSRPMSYNLWLYVYANPVNLTDPSGANPIDDIVVSLKDKTEKCYHAGDLDCVWRNYYALAVGGRILGYTYAAEHMFRFLQKRGDIVYKPGPTHPLFLESSYWVLSSNAVQTELPNRESEILKLIHMQAKNGILVGYLETEPESVRIKNVELDRDLYYAMNIFALWAEVDFEVTGCYEVIVKPTFRFWDAYDWHIGLPAGGAAIGMAGFMDDWAAALHDAGKALEYEVSGYWFGPNKIFTFPSNWLIMGVPLPPISERPAPPGRN